MSDQTYTPVTLRALFGAHGLEGLFDTTALGKDGTVYDAKDEGRAHADAWQAKLAAAKAREEALREALANELCDCGMRDDHRRSLHAASCVWAQWLDALAASEPPGTAEGEVKHD